jgi:hypothetical protein
MKKSVIIALTMFALVPLSIFKINSVLADGSSYNTTAACDYPGATATCMFYNPNGSGYKTSSCVKRGQRATGSGGNIQVQGKCGSCINPYDSQAAPVDCADDKAYVDAGE